MRRQPPGIFYRDLFTIYEPNVLAWKSSSAMYGQEIMILTESRQNSALRNHDIADHFQLVLGGEARLKHKNN
jgi:hypothetical protein